MPPPSRAAERPVDVCVVTSHGGHLELALSLAPAYRDREHVLVAAPSPQTDAAAARGVPVRRLVNPKRSPVLLARNAAQALALVRELRPRLVVSTGAGVTVSFCLAAKIRGSTLIFVETMARVADASATGRIMHRLADRFLVQWPELLDVYPRAEICRPALLEQIGSSTRANGHGTFVSTGTHGQPFDRLLRWADDAAAEGALPDPVLAQAGTSSYEPRHLRKVDFLSPAEVEEAIAGSAVVVGHGGSGLVAVSLRNGRRPLVMPRRAEHGEHVDDHQVAVTRKLAEMELVVDLDATDTRGAVVAGRRSPCPNESGIEGPPLAARLRELIGAELDR